MRIISEFKDVYDLQHAMFDKERTWTRRTETIMVKRDEALPSLYRPSAYWYRGLADIQYFPVFIAGVVHYVYAFQHEGKFYKSTVDGDKAVEIAKEIGINTMRLFGKNALDDIESVATQSVELKQLAYNLFRELKVPLGYINRVVNSVPDENSKQEVPCYEVIVNPRLHNSIIPWTEIDPNVYRLHQELEQYLWGVLGTGEPDMLTTSDKDRLLAKGFDAVTSFRNMPRD